VLLMPCSEFDGWFAYFEWQNKERKKAQNKSNKGKQVQTI